MRFSREREGMGWRLKLEVATVLQPCAQPRVLLGDFLMRSRDAWDTWCVSRIQASSEDGRVGGKLR